MNENNPNNQETKRPLSPEEIEVLRQRQEALKKADQVLKAMEKGESRDFGVPFEGPPSEKLATEIAEQVGIQPKSQAPVGPVEEGLDRVQQEKLDRDPEGWIAESIGNPKLAANDKMKGLIEAMEQEEKRKAA